MRSPLKSENAKHPPPLLSFSLIGEASSYVLSPDNDELCQPQQAIPLDTLCSWQPASIQTMSVPSALQVKQDKNQSLRQLSKKLEKWTHTPLFLFPWGKSCEVVHFSQFWAVSAWGNSWCRKCEIALLPVSTQLFLALCSRGLLKLLSWILEFS